MAFVISAAYAGLAGGLYAHLINFISPDTFSSTQSTLFMTILLFGGMANLAGPLVGSVVLLTIKEFLQSFSTYQMMVYSPKYHKAVNCVPCLYTAVYQLLLTH